MTEMRITHVYVVMGYGLDDEWVIAVFGSVEDASEYAAGEIWYKVEGPFPFYPGSE